MFIPVVGLASFHIGLVCMGRTTNEHVRYCTHFTCMSTLYLILTSPHSLSLSLSLPLPPSLQVTGKFRGANNPYDLGCVKNCASVLCAPKKPRYMHYQIKPYQPVREPRRQGGSAQSSQGEVSPHRVAPAPLNDLRCMPVYEELDNHASIHATLQNVCR